MCVIIYLLVSLTGIELYLSKSRSGKKIKKIKKEKKKDNKTFHINPKKSLKSLEILCENLINKFRFNFNCKTCQDFIGLKKKR